MSIKLVAIDIDGTLIDSNRNILPAVKDALQKARAQGVKIVLCTGRPQTGVTALLEELDLVGEDNYVITYNGSLVETTTGKTLIRHALTHDDFLEIEMMSRKLNIPLHTHVSNPPRLICTNRNIPKYSVYEAFLVDVPLFYRAPEEVTADETIIKMMYIDEGPRLEEALAHLPQSFYEKYTCVRSESFFFEILNKNATKGNAMLDLAAHLGIDPSETMAIGDNENDLSMIQAAGIGVAMGNAVPLVKEHADFITKTNDEAGVAYVIQEKVL